MTCFHGRMKPNIDGDTSEPMWGTKDQHTLVKESRAPHYIIVEDSRAPQYIVVEESPVFMSGVRNCPCLTVVSPLNDTGH